MDAVDRAIVNRLQQGIALTERPYAQAAAELGLEEGELISRLEALLSDGVLSRFGPLYRAEKLGGGVTLAAIEVPAPDFDRVAAIVNAFTEVAHNYQRDHAFNMWFVIAAERPERIGEVVEEIERRTGLEVLELPRIREFYVGARFEA